VEKYGPVLQALGKAVAEERLRSPWLVDPDVAEVYKALAATLKTLSSGIYYESLPEGPVRLSLFRALKPILDALMEPSEAQPRMLRTKAMKSARAACTSARGPKSWTKRLPSGVSTTAAESAWSGSSEAWRR